MNEQQEQLIREFLDECRQDGINDKNRLAFELTGFLKSLGNQQRDNNLRTIASDPEAIAKLVNEMSVGKPNEGNQP